MRYGGPIEEITVTLLGCLISGPLHCWMGCAQGEPPELLPAGGTFVSIWIQWLPEVIRREKLRRRGKYPESRGDRNYLITCSLNVDTDAKLLGRWGTSAVEPPSDHDKYSMKAIARR